MNSPIETLAQALVSSIKERDVNKVRSILDNDEDRFICLQASENLLHVICDRQCFESPEDFENVTLLQKEKDIIYMLVDAGYDLESIDKNGNTCLFIAVMNENPFICDILLQCGADLCGLTKFHIPIQEYVDQTASDEIKEVFRKYFPGLWSAVEREDIYKVRKLVNLWCKTDLKKNNITLKDIALDTGNEEIIGLILGILDSMRLVYHIYAKNTKAVAMLLDANRHRVRLELKKMSDRGAPIIYYLIQSEDIPTINLFIKYGCQLFTIMQDDQGIDMPVLFSALKSGVPVNVVKALLPSGKPHQEELLYKLLYRGQTVLEVALANNADIEVFNLLIDRGGPLLLCDRNQMNQTVRDLALLANKTQYADTIDSIVTSWILDPMKFPGLREKLSLYGYQLNIAKVGLNETSSVNDYFTQSDRCQVLMEQISEAIQLGNMENFLQLKSYLSENPENYLWHGKVLADVMPLLHKAVLHNRIEMVEIILAEKPPKESIDNLFDQNRRTALHYAYASVSVTGIKNLLTSYGCSEHVLDKVGREPLDFRDRQDTELMTDLLHRLKSKEFTTPEPDPWTIIDTETRCDSKMLPCCPQLNDNCADEQEECSSDYESDCTSDVSDQNVSARSCTIY